MLKLLFHLALTPGNSQEKLFSFFFHRNLDDALRRC